MAPSTILTGITSITPVLRPLLTAAQARAIDQHTIDVVGVPGLVLMEHAGRAVANVVVDTARDDRVVVVVCGGGNNGGDGFVCARHLLGRGVHVVVVTTRDRAALKGDAATAARLLDNAIVARGLDPAVVVTAFDAHKLVALRPAIVVDALFGIGLSRALDDDSAAVVAAIAAARAAGALVVAVDIPSGLPADGEGAGAGAVVDADITVTFGEKIAHRSEPGTRHCGRVVDVDIGFVADSAAVIDIFALDGIRLPALDTGAHKNRYGHVGVVVGGEGTRGAASLSARAAQRAGAGLVTLLGEATMPRADELMARDLDDEDAFAGLDVVVVGPGLPPKVALSLRGRLRAARDKGLQIVADAGALGALTHGDADVWTPHPGEAARVLGVDSRAVQADRVAAARALVKALGGVVVLKGACPIVATAEQLVIVDGGSVAMAVAGSGDVLAGIIAAALGGALGAGTTASRAIAAVHLHQQAGKGEGRGLFASELADRVRDAVAVARG